MHIVEIDNKITSANSLFDRWPYDRNKHKQKQQLKEANSSAGPKKENLSNIINFKYFEENELIKSVELHQTIRMDPELSDFDTFHSPVDDIESLSNDGPQMDLVCDLQDAFEPLQRAR